MGNSPLKRAGEALFHVAGAPWLRWWHRDSARILMYHRFRDISGFERQCDHLRNHYHPVSMTELAEHLRKGQPLPSKSVAVTVDDGYRDFLERAFPILDRYRIPVTAYLTTDLMDHDGWLWVDQVMYLFARTPREEVTVEVPGAGTRCWRLGTERERKRAGFDVKEQLKKIANSARLDFLARLPACLKIELPTEAPGFHKPLSWTDVRFLAAKGVEFGGHTRTHPILSRLESREQLEAEIAGSKKRIEQEIGIEARHFCYPNGTSADFNAEAIEVTKNAGFLTAVTGEPGINGAGADPYLLRRIAAEPDWSNLYFTRKVAGHLAVKKTASQPSPHL